MTLSTSAPTAVPPWPCWPWRPYARCSWCGWAAAAAMARRPLSPTRYMWLRPAGVRAAWPGAMSGRSRSAAVSCSSSTPTPPTAPSCCASGCSLGRCATYISTARGAEFTAAPTTLPGCMGSLWANSGACALTYASLPTSGLPPRSWPTACRGATLCASRSS